MRIISGKYKGRIVEGFQLEGVRPTKGLVRESIIGTVQNDLMGASVLDLFAGTGLMGLEMVSNGANYLVLNDHQTHQTLLNNIKNIDDNIMVYNDEAINCLKKLAKSNISFDIIFIDPPYFYYNHNKIIKMIEEKELLNDNGWLIIELDNKEIITNSKFKEIKLKKYGNTKVIFYRNI